MSGLPDGECNQAPDRALRQRLLRRMSHAAATGSVVTTDGIASRPMDAGAQAFAQHCRILIGAAHAHPHP